MNKYALSTVYRLACGIICVTLLFITVGGAGPAAAQSQGEITSVTHPETVSTDGTFQITVETTKTAGTIVSVSGAEINAAESSSGKITGNRIEFLDPSVGSSTYTVAVDYTGSATAQTVTVTTWINASQQSAADDTYSADIQYSGDTSEEPSDGQVSAPGGVTIPSKYTKSGSSNVGSGGLQQVAVDFRGGSASAGDLQNVAIAFRNS